jgi:hypothetical protein
MCTGFDFRDGIFVVHMIQARVGVAHPDYGIVASIPVRIGRENFQALADCVEVLKIEFRIDFIC